MVAQVGAPPARRSLASCAAHLLPAELLARATGQPTQFMTPRSIEKIRIPSTTTPSAPRTAAIEFARRAERVGRPWLSIRASRRVVNRRLPA
jgi:hypothetical protein